MARFKLQPAPATTKKPAKPKPFRLTPDNQPMEHHTQIAFIEAIDRMACVQKELKANFHPPNGSKRNPQEGARLKRMGMRKGPPDWFLFVRRNGYTGLVIEFKRQGSNGKLDADQIEWRDMLIAQGWKHAVHTDASKALDEVRNYLRVNS